MTVKQFKRRVINGLVETDLFKMPVGKKEKKRIDRIYLSFQELAYVNYYNVLEEYPEYSEQILSINKYINLKSGAVEAILFDENYSPIFKTNIYTNTNSFTIRNIPCGIYHIRIIKGYGFQLKEYTIEVTEKSNENTYIIELTRSFIKVEIDSDDGVNSSTIYENNSYTEVEESNKVSPWLIDHCLFCDVSGRVYYKYYTYDNKYLGKAVIGHSIYDTDFIDVSNMGFYSYYCFKYFPTNLTDEHITGNYTSRGEEYLGRSVVKDNSYMTKIIGDNDSINMPTINKGYYPQLITEISYIPNKSVVPERTYTNSRSVSSYANSFTYQQECYIDVNIDGTLKKEFVGYNLYFEDGLTKEIHDNIVMSVLKISSMTPVYLMIRKDGILSNSVTDIAYDDCKLENENTICYYNNYTVISDDYEDYNSFDIVYYQYIFA